MQIADLCDLQTKIVKLIYDIKQVVASDKFNVARAHKNYQREWEELYMGYRDLGVRGLLMSKPPKHFRSHHPSLYEKSQRDELQRVVSPHGGSQSQYK